MDTPKTVDSPQEFLRCRSAHCRARRRLRPLLGNGVRQRSAQRILRHRRGHWRIGRSRVLRDQRLSHRREHIEWSDAALLRDVAASSHLSRTAGLPARLHPCRNVSDPRQSERLFFRADIAILPWQYFSLLLARTTRIAWSVHAAVERHERAVVDHQIRACLLHRDAWRFPVSASRAPICFRCALRRCAVPLARAG